MIFENHATRNRLKLARIFPAFFLDGLYLPFCIVPLRIRPRSENPIVILTTARASVSQCYGDVKHNLMDCYSHDDFVKDLNLLLGDRTTFSRPISHFLFNVKIAPTDHWNRKLQTDWETLVNNRSNHFRFLLRILSDRKRLNSYYEECRTYIEQCLPPESLRTFWHSREWLDNCGRGAFKDFLERKGIGHNAWLHNELPDKYRFQTAFAGEIRAIIESHYDATDGPKLALAKELAAEREAGRSRQAPLLPIRLCPHKCLYMPWHFRKCPTCNIPTREICCHICRQFFAGWLTRCPSCQSPISAKHCLYCGDDQGKEILSGSPLSDSSHYYCPGCERIHGTRQRSEFATFNSSEPENTSPVSADGLQDKLRRFLYEHDSVGAALLVFDVATRPHQATQPDDAVRTVYKLLPDIVASTFDIPQSRAFRNVIKDALHPDDIGDWIKHQYLELLVFTRVLHPKGLAHFQDGIHLPPHVDRLDHQYLLHAAEEQRDAILEAKQLFDATHDKRAETRRSEELEQELKRRELEQQKQLEQHQRDRDGDADQHKKDLRDLQREIKLGKDELREVYNNQLEDIRAAIKKAEQEPRTPETLAYIKDQKDNEAKILQRLERIAD